MIAIEAEADGAAIQALLDAHPGETFTLAGEHALDFPLRITAANTSLVGENRAGSRLVQSNHVVGPVLIVGPREDGPLLGPSLVPGPGSALRLRPNRVEHFDLRDSPLCALGDKTSFSIAFFHQVVEMAPQNYGAIMISGGQRTFAEGRSEALSLWCNPHGSLRAELQLSSGRVVLTTPAGTIEAGVTYHYALDYDGSALRLWLGQPGHPSVLVASASGSGTVVQAMEETWTVGHAPRWWPESDDPWRAPMDSWIDSLCVGPSKYTSPFTAPDHKHEATAASWFTLNFDDVRGDLIVATMRANVRIPLRIRRTTGVAASRESRNVRVQELTIKQSAGTGLVAYRAPGLVIDSVSILGGRRGITLRNTCYTSLVRNVYCLVSEYGIANVNASGVNLYQHVSLASTGYGFIAAASSVTLDNFFINLCTKPGVYLLGRDKVNVASLRSVVISDEGQGGAYEAGILLCDMNLVDFHGGISFEKFDSPVLLLDGVAEASRTLGGVDSAKIRAGIHLHKDGVAPVVRFLRDVGSSRVVLDECTFRNPHVLSSAAGGAGVFRTTST